MIKQQKQHIAYFKIITCLAVFLAMFIFNLIFPIEKSLFHFYSITNRAWCCCEFLVLGLAVFYIFKIRTMNFKDLAVSCLLGIILIVFFDKDAGYIQVVATIVCYYSACQIFRYYSKQDKYFDLDVKNNVKSFFKGCLYAIPFALINDLAIYLTYTNKQINNFKAFSVFSIFSEAKSALSPGISEEVIFHFFLLAFVVDVFKGDIPKKKFALYLTYLLTVVPHSLIHLPDVILSNPLMALFQLVFTSVLFGFPMVWLVKNKNLQTSIGFHWGVDFFRFLFLSW